MQERYGWTKRNAKQKIYFHKIKNQIKNIDKRHALVRIGHLEGFFFVWITKIDNHNFHISTREDTLVIIQLFVYLFGIECVGGDDRYYV